jgi:stage V sporulation protein G
MKVEVIRYTPHESKNGKLIGFADVSFDGVLVVKGIRLLNGENGKFIAPPSKPRNNKPNQYDDIVYFTKEGSDLKKKVLDEILDAADETEGTSKGKKSKLDF